MIQQPRLGELLINLRRKKGWTQEELVEACNVSVRTIQRIESGDVTPRSSTVRLLLEALDYDPEEWKEFIREEQSDRSPFKLLKKMLALNLPEDQLKKSFHDAWIAGIIFLTMFIVDAAAEYIIGEDYQMTGRVSYVTIKIAVIGSFFLFMRGFISLSILFQNHLLKISCYLYIATLTMLYLSDIIILLYFPGLDEFDGVLGAMYLVVNGAIGIFYGVGLRRLQDGMGRAAKYAGTLEIVMGACMLTLVLAVVALPLFPVGMILEILILSKADELSQKGQL